MNAPSRFLVRSAEWVADAATLRAIRAEVFVEEQGVAPELEWDDEDEHAWHVLAMNPDGTMVGTGRLLRDGHIGRMAVLRPWRGVGVGAALLAELLRVAQALGLNDLVLHAQTHAIGFYARYGFEPEGETFIEAGIPHRTMRRRLL
jgi:predicted GNAT family N-acyltransferase